MSFAHFLGEITTVLKEMRGAGGGGGYHRKALGCEVLEQVPATQPRGQAPL